MQTLADAARDAVPIVVGYVTLGLAAGMLLVAEGLAWWWAPVWSLVIYSGTMQMLLVPLAGGGEQLATIALSTYVMDDGLSGRFILMGVLTIMVAVVGHLARRAGQRTQDEGRGPRD